MLVSPLKLLNKIKSGKSLCAFNFSTFEVAQTIVKTAAEKNSPIILQTSMGEANSLNPEIAFAIANFLSQKYAFPLALNLDHGQDLALIRRCLAIGYTAIHIDGSALPFEENVKITQEVKKLCQEKNVSIEGEIGQINGRLTDPQAAVRFIKETEVDFLAVSVGSKHGLIEPEIQFDLLNKIYQLIKLPLVLHGGSGISQKDLEKAVSLGIRKINFNSELRSAWAKTLRQTLNDHPQEIVPYKILPAIEEPIAKIVERKLMTCSL